MPGFQGETNFYSIPEDRLKEMAEDHYGGEEDAKSGFSSWAASLHLVLCYASSMEASQHPHIAVMDTRTTGVLVWHCQNLLGECDHEYLAYGPIHGRGYRAVPLEDLKVRGLHTLCPELEGAYLEETVYQFGCQYRKERFGGVAAPITDDQVHIAERVALCFGSLFPPVFTAMLCLEPRSEFHGSKGILFDDDLVKRVHRTIERAVPSNFIQDMNSWPLWFWDGVVDTSGNPDVRQWITLFSTVMQLEQTDSKMVKAKVGTKQRWGSPWMTDSLSRSNRSRTCGVLFWDNGDRKNVWQTCSIGRSKTKEPEQIYLTVRRQVCFD